MTLIPLNVRAQGVLLGGMVGLEGGSQLIQLMLLLRIELVLDAPRIRRLQTPTVQRAM